MNKEEIRCEAEKRMELIELHCLDAYVSLSIQAYYRLCHLIALGSFESYFHHYGWLKVDSHEANEGSMEVFRKPLSDFQRDTTAILNRAIDLNERADFAKRSVRTIGLAQ